MIHPNDREQRRKYKADKTLIHPLFREKKINKDKRKKLVEIQDAETKDELFYADTQDYN